MTIVVAQTPTVFREILLTVAVFKLTWGMWKLRQGGRAIYSISSYLSFLKSFRVSFNDWVIGLSDCVFSLGVLVNKLIQKGWEINVPGYFCFTSGCEFDFSGFVALTSSNRTLKLICYVRHLAASNEPYASSYFRVKNEIAAGNPFQKVCVLSCFETSPCSVNQGTLCDVMWCNWKFKATF